VISDFLKTWSREMGAICPIQIVPNGVDIKYFSNKVSADGLVELKNKLNKKEGDVFLITTSRLVKKNAVEDIISSLQFLPSNIKLLVLGDGELKNKLNDQVNKMKLNDRVNFLGYIDRKELPKYLQISDIFIRPSITEGFGISFIEAMASGLPVIATKVGGIVDFIIDKKTGVFCEVNNPKDIADKVQMILNDNRLKDELIINSKKLVSEKYNWNNISENMRKIFSNFTIL
jgi:teichuronic acid biosynthesis glycosyltransferase TuaC